MVRIHLWNLPDDITTLRARHLREVVEHAPDIDTLLERLAHIEDPERQRALRIPLDIGT